MGKLVALETGLHHRGDAEGQKQRAEDDAQQQRQPVILHKEHQQRQKRKGHHQQIEEAVPHQILPQLGSSAGAGVHQLQVEEQLAGGTPAHEPFQYAEIQHYKQRVEAERHQHRQKNGKLASTGGGKKGQNVDHHDEEQNQQNHAVQRRRKQSAQNGHVFAALIGDFLHSVGRRQEAGELRGDQIAKIAAQSIGDNIIHIR